ncbi:hypothetical protein BN1723_017237, partial [Verticillium longisporum]
AEAEDDESA